MTKSRKSRPRGPRNSRPVSGSFDRPRSRWGVVAALAAIVTLVIGGAWLWLGGSHPPRVEGPIILISIDTLRADHLPIYGYRNVQTPAIDQLARDAVVFDRAYAHSPQTLPSHTSLFTGKLPFEHGVRDNLGFSVKQGARTLASLLNGQGFATAGFVSAYVLRGETGIGQGFGTYDDRFQPTPVQRDGAATLAEAERWLDAQTSNRLFLFLHLYEPHSPYAPPERYRHYDPYDGEIAYSDELVGRLMASLERRRLYSGALVILLSDHGEGLGDHGEQEHGLFLYSETIRVPLIVKLPDGRHAGRRVTTPVQHLDLLPTILDLLGTGVPGDLRGRSLVPAFAGRAIPEQGLYAETLQPRYSFGWSELYALTDTRYRFIRAPRDELYDLEQDAKERRNVVAERPQTAGAMRQALERLLAGAAIDTPASVSTEDRERLRALGYIGSQATPASAAGASSLPDPKDKIDLLKRYGYALALAEEGSTDDAISQLRAIADENPGMAEVWERLGGLLVRQGRIEEAIAAYKHEIIAGAQNPAPLVVVAQLLLQLGRLDEAAGQARLALDTLSAEERRWRMAASVVLIRIAFERKNVVAARQEAQRARDADRLSPLPEYVEGLVRYGDQQYSDALPHFEAALRLTGDGKHELPELRYHLGETLGRLERYREAEAVLQDEVHLFPHNLRAHAALVMLYRAQGKIAESDEAIVAMLRLSPTAQAYDLAEQLWAMAGERGKAADVRAQASHMFSAR